MNGKELMLGDLVQSQDGNVYKIRTLFSHDVVYVGSKDGALSIRYNALKPIDITREILEKNGWNMDMQYAYKDIGDDKYLEYYFFEHRLRKWYDGVDEWNNHYSAKDVVFQCTARYIHELQHALKMCKINDKIIL